MLIGTDRFVDACKTMARIGGLPDARWAVVPHPLGSATETVLRERAESVVEQLASILLA